jgi:hypothetical protein
MENRIVKTGFIILLTVLVSGVSAGYGQAGKESRMLEKEQEKMKGERVRLEAEADVLEVEIEGLSSLHGLDALESLGSLDALDGLESLESLDALDGLEILRDHDIDDDQDASAQAYKNAYNFILDEKWAEALNALKAFIKA